MALADVLALVKDNEQLTKEITDTYGLAEATGKIKEANAELTGQRSKWETEKASLTQKIKDLESAGGEETPAMRKLREDLQSVTTQLAEEKQAREQAAADKLNSDVDSALISALGGKATNAKQVALLMKAEGLAGHKDGKPFYYRLNEKGEQVEAKDHSEAVEAYLGANKHLQAASGSSGSGDQPNRGGGKTTEGLLDNETARNKL